MKNIFLSFPVRKDFYFPSNVLLLECFVWNSKFFFIHWTFLLAQEKKLFSHKLVPVDYGRRLNRAIICYELILFFATQKLHGPDQTVWLLLWFETKMREIRFSSLTRRFTIALVFFTTSFLENWDENIGLAHGFPWNHPTSAKLFLSKTACSLLFFMLFSVFYLCCVWCNILWVVEGGVIFSLLYKINLIQIYDA